MSFSVGRIDGRGCDRVVSELTVVALGFLGQNTHVQEENHNYIGIDDRCLVNCGLNDDNKSKYLVFAKENTVV